MILKKNVVYARCGRFSAHLHNKNFFENNRGIESGPARKVFDKENLGQNLILPGATPYLVPPPRTNDIKTGIRSRYENHLFLLKTRNGI